MQPSITPHKNSLVIRALFLVALLSIDSPSPTHTKFCHIASNEADAADSSHENGTWHCEEPCEYFRFLSLRMYRV
ncbi:hypothetical protein BGY98DRAFT_986997 [Russula aff. rugulosa BPL654]|nr:hypothetical protein BGY98DRAFT_986997 [Russula aff. rugulosa BPL654]